MLLQLL